MILLHGAWKCWSFSISSLAGPFIIQSWGKPGNNPQWKIMIFQCSCRRMPDIMKGRFVQLPICYVFMSNNSLHSIMAILQMTATCLSSNLILLQEFPVGPCCKTSRRTLAFLSSLSEAWNVNCEFLSFKNSWVESFATLNYSTCQPL